MATININIENLIRKVEITLPLSADKKQDFDGILKSALLGLLKDTTDTGASATHKKAVQSP